MCLTAIDLALTNGDITLIFDVMTAICYLLWLMYSRPSITSHSLALIKAFHLHGLHSNQFYAITWPQIMLLILIKYSEATNLLLKLNIFLNKQQPSSQQSLIDNLYVPGIAAMTSRRNSVRWDRVSGLYCFLFYVTYTWQPQVILMLGMPKVYINN